MINIMLKNVDLNDKWWIKLIKTINYFRNRFSMIDKSIISYEIDTKKKLSFAHRRIETIDYVMKRKSITKWKKLFFKSFSIVFVSYEKNHIYRMLRFNEIIYRVLFIIWIKEKHLHNAAILIETSSKRSIFESINSSTKRQAFESNLVTIFISIQIFQSASMSFSSSIIEINTSFNDSVSTIFLALNSLKRYFELRYRLDSFDSLKLLIMKCIKNVIDFQQALKSRSYKKAMNDSSRKKWIKIMKNENNFFLINEIWTLINFLKIDEYFATNEFTRSKKKNTTRFCVTKRAEWFKDLNKSKDWITRKHSFRWLNQWIIKQCTS
jgi:hypothetical protein